MRIRNFALTLVFLCTLSACSMKHHEETAATPATPVVAASSDAHECAGKCSGDKTECSKKAECGKKSCDCPHSCGDKKSCNDKKKCCGEKGKCDAAKKCSAAKKCGSH